MKKTTLLLLVALSVQMTFAQKKTKLKDSIPKHRFEVGTDLLWLIDKNTLPAYTMQLKIHNKPGKRDGAWRFKVGIDFEDNDSTEDFSVETIPPFWKFNKIRGVINVGYQFNHKNNDFLIYYGCDSYFGIEYSHKDQYHSTYYDDRILADYDSYYYDITRKSQYGLNFFIGFNYYLNKTISFSLESKLNAQYEIYKWEWGFYRHYNFTPDELYMFRKKNQFKVNLLPICLLNINIHF